MQADQQRLERLILEMMRFYAGDPGQIQHFVKVHSFARWIGMAEGMGEKGREILEIAAIVHDIGIKPALEKHGSGSGKFQELEGPPVAKRLLEELEYPPEIVDRVCYLVGHHHTYTDIDGDDYQILVEADFLVNMHEGGMEEGAMRSVLGKVFRTRTGIEFCKTMFGIEL